MPGGGAAGSTPLPEASNDCGLPTPVLTTVMTAVLNPDTAGLNDTVNVHVASLASTLQPEFATLNSAGAELTMLDTVTESTPVLRSVTVDTALEPIPTVWGNDRFAGCEIWPRVGGGGDGVFDTPHELHAQLGLTVPSAHRTFPLLAQLLVMPPWLEQHPGQAIGHTCAVAVLTTAKRTNMSAPRTALTPSACRYPLIVLPWIRSKGDRAPGRHRAGPERRPHFCDLRRRIRVYARGQQESRPACAIPMAWSARVIAPSSRTAFDVVADPAESRAAAQSFEAKVLPMCPEQSVTDVIGTDREGFGRPYWT